MMKNLLLDTCVLIDYLRDKSAADTFISDLHQTPFLSAITVAELYGGVREGKERELLDGVLKLFHVVPVSEDIGKNGGLYRRLYHGSHGVGLFDAVIGATAEYLDADLVTLNKKHFPMIPSLIVPY
jgi:predicted nucleic acid-binding protein